MTRKPDYVRRIKRYPSTIELRTKRAHRTFRRRASGQLANEVPSTSARMQSNPRLTNTILYLLHNRGSARPGIQALLKMLWYADYWHYGEHLSVITKAEYVAMPNGPVISDYKVVFAELESSGVLQKQLVDVFNKPNKKEEYLPLVEPDEDEFGDSERAILQRVIQECAGKSGSALSDQTHREGPWQLVWDERRQNGPIHRTAFRWLENLPDDDDRREARQSLLRPSVQDDIRALTSQ